VVLSAPGPDAGLPDGVLAGRHDDGGRARLAAGAALDRRAGLAAGASLPGLALLVYAAWRLDGLLRAFQARDVFSAAAIAHVRAFAGGALGALLLAIAEQPLRALLWRHMLGIDGAAVQVSVSSESLLMMVACGLFYVFGGVLREGRRLAEENEGFV
jgi:hypothetical protein